MHDMKMLGVPRGDKEGDPITRAMDRDLWSFQPKIRKESRKRKRGCFGSSESEDFQNLESRPKETIILPGLIRGKSFIYKKEEFKAAECIASAWKSKLDKSKVIKVE
mmetsp:Transcript_3679/g.4502  ORF Transcript_3679/g.4502 Transcript_3679/m.4502 type:complete len:107 (-) Transcript_3679:3-323(-)